MIELVVALVVILALAAGLLQIASLGRAHTETMVAARREAGSLAMNPMAPLDSADYILDWMPGPDGRRLTRDDLLVNGNTAPFKDLIIDHAADNEGQWDVLNTAERSDLPALRNDPDPVSRLGLVRGYHSETVPLLSAVQHLLYNAQAIEIQGEVWMTYTGNIY